MTAPSERTRALLWAGGFLVELAWDESLPPHVRERAVAVARHFPTVGDVTNMAGLERVSGLDLGLGLAMPSEVEGWVEGCLVGPLRRATELDWPMPSKAKHGRGRDAAADPPRAPWNR